MNGFERHGIKHSSPSAINMWCESQGAWVAKYLYKRNFPFGFAARAGTLAESAVVSVLRDGVSEQEAIDRVMKEYHRASLFHKTDDIIKRGEAIPEMVKGFLSELKPYGKPTFNDDGSQVKLSINCKTDDWSLPIIGFIDLYFKEHNLTIDLKTSFKAPSTISAEHKRQQAIYQTAFGMPAKFLYATPKKTVWLEAEPEEVKDTMSEIKIILTRQENMLKIGEKDDIRNIVHVNDSSYYWKDAQDIKKELFNY